MNRWRDTAHNSFAPMSTLLEKGRVNQRPKKPSNRDRTPRRDNRHARKAGARRAKRSRDNQSLWDSEDVSSDSSSSVSSTEEETRSSKKQKKSKKPNKMRRTCTVESPEATNQQFRTVRFRRLPALRDGIHEPVENHPIAIIDSGADQCLLGQGWRVLCKTGRKLQVTGAIAGTMDGGTLDVVTAVAKLETMANKE